MRNEERKKSEEKHHADKEIVTWAQVNQEEQYKATTNANSKVNTQVHNAVSSIEASQEPLVLSTYQLHLHQELNPTGIDLSSTEEEQMTVYQRAIEGINNRNDRHVTILTTLPNIDQWPVSMIQYMNTAQEFIRTQVKEGEITLRIRPEDEVEVTSEAENGFQEFTWEESWETIEETNDEANNEVDKSDKIKERDKKCTTSKSWEYLELDCPEKKETIRKWRQAIMYQPVYLWIVLYNLIFFFTTPQKHIKIDDKEY